jgi:hypothetical protein
MTSKRLGAILRSAPPATALPETGEAATGVVLPALPQLHDNAPVASRQPIKPESIDPEVPLQVLIPAHLRRELAIMAAEQGVSLRTLVLRAIRGLGLTVSEAEIKGKRGRRNS